MNLGGVYEHVPDSAMPGQKSSSKPDIGMMLPDSNEHCTGDKWK